MIVPEGVSGVAFGTAADGDPRTDAATRASISAALGAPTEWAWVRQVHGSTVVRAAAPGIGDEADGVFTAEIGLAVAVSVADCLPVALVSDGAVGMAHAGWRGAAEGVVEATARAMADDGHPPHTMVIGPGIGPCCFEVGPEVAERFPSHGATTTWGTTSVDLAGAVADAADVRVVAVDACTHHEDRFHSFRRDGTEERQFGVAWLTSA